MGHRHRGHHAGRDCGCGHHGHHGHHGRHGGWDCGCGHHGGHRRHGGRECGCGHRGHHGLKRRYWSREEKVAWLEQYLQDLENEAQAVRERLAEMKEG